MKPLKIILGSSSPWRQQIMAEMGYDFSVMSPDIDEKAIRFDDARQLVLALAHAKAEALKKRLTDPVIIVTADQVGTCNGVILEKPTSEADVWDFYEQYTKYPSETLGAVVVTNTANGKVAEGLSLDRFHLKPVPDQVIKALIDDGRIFSCAGAIRVEDPLIVPYIASFEGTQDSIMGLNKALTRRLIEEVQ